MLETVFVQTDPETRQAKAPLRERRFLEGVVANLGMLRRVAPAHVAALGRQCSVVSARRGTVVARRDARLPGVFVLAYGSVELVLRGAGQEKRTLRLVAPGETFGKASALLGRACRYEAVALLESKLVVLPAAAIVDLTERDPHFAHALTMELAEGTLRMLAEMEALTMQRGAQRLASYLASLAGPGAPSDGPCTVQLPVSKTVVAGRLGIKKETLSRLFRDFIDNGLIVVAQRNISILNPDGLAQVARM